MLKKNFMVPGSISSKRNRLAFKFAFKSARILTKPVAFQFFVFVFFSHTRAFSRPIHHTEEEFDSPVPLSRRFREIWILDEIHEFGPQLELYHFFISDFFQHLYHAEKNLMVPGHHQVEIVEIREFRPKNPNFTIFFLWLLLSPGGVF
jgi:hypothetical protein